MFRCVSLSEAQNAAEAEEFVFQESGQVVFPVRGQTVAIAGGWRVRVQSFDGHQSNGPASGESKATTAPTPQDFGGERRQFESVGPNQVDGWCPKNSPKPDAGKE